MVLLATGLAGVGLGPDAFTAAAAERPNVVVILADDQGWGDLSVHGNPNLATPNIDSLARDGALLEHFYVCPVCSPTRAEFLTGRYHPRGGVFSTSAGGERLDLDERTVAEAFQAAGYATGAFGKWHNGSQGPYHPNARGFEEFYGFTSGHWGHYFSPMLEHNGEIVTGHGYLADDLTEHALAFIQANGGKRPFFVYLPFNIPHSPMQVPERFYARFADAPVTARNRNPDQEDVAFTRAALAMCENIDWNVGRVLGKIRDLGIERDTIVIYFSDNGPNSWRWNGGMKGRKGSTDEGGVRSPFLIRWPGRITPGRRIAGIAGAIDLLPTLTGLAGISRVGSAPLDGLSLEPILFGEPAPVLADRMIFSHWNGNVSVRTQRHRLDARGALFDMEADPGQMRDVAGEHPEMAGRLRAAVAQWKADLLPGLRDDHRPFPVGHPVPGITQLPARDAKFTDGVKRSNRFPNCSYLTNWTSPQDRIRFDVEVLQAGRYEAVLYYACPPADVGSTLELSFGDARVRGVLDAANDPPLVGAEQDRVPRGESYVKDFKPWRLGELLLPVGRGELALRAVAVPGQQVMEFRLLSLRLLP
ncbi:MAG: arylsulfatase [Verrucomicrobiales bacterium]|nr:arylsulfatase [Verrucomicrobiales bacterium]